MNILEAASNMLRRHNRWRRGDDTVEAVDPALLGCAIDTVCDHIEQRAKVPDESVDSIIAAYKAGLKHGEEQPDYEFEFASGSPSDAAYSIGYNEGYEKCLSAQSAQEGTK